MKFKIDENFGTRTQRLSLERGLAVHTEKEERLSGATDELIFETCAKEGRAASLRWTGTFSGILRFPPEPGAGVAVIRVPQNPTLDTLERLVVGFLDLVKLYWVVPAVGRFTMRHRTLAPSPGRHSDQSTGAITEGRPSK